MPGAVSRPIDTTVHPAGTCAVTENVALSRGVSFTGYQNDAECGSPTMYAPPSDECCQPFSLPPSCGVFAGSPP